MGLLIDGRWHDTWYETKENNGAFVRPRTQFRQSVRADGSSPFAAEPGRYHLYVSLACPWAHRTLIVRALKGLEEAIGVSVVHPFMGSNGWSFEPGEGVIPDPHCQAQLLQEIYLAASPQYTGRVTVPILWDAQTHTIVNNESAEILRMFNGEFNALARNPELDLYPMPLRDAIDAINETVYQNVNNGVYRCGFATSQQAYNQAVTQLFHTLDDLEKRLRNQPYLVGDVCTEADWRLFTTLIRFDCVYAIHFKCSIRRLTDYPALCRHTQELYEVAGIKETVNVDHIKRHYYGSHPSINPNGIVPIGPDLPFDSLP